MSDLYRNGLDGAGSGSLWPVRSLLRIVWSTACLFQRTQMRSILPMREPACIFALTLCATVLSARLADGANPHQLEAGGTPVTMESRATLQFDPVPAWALADEVTPLRLHGAEPGQVVTLRLRSKDSQGRTWEAHAGFRATSDGRIDVATDVPLSGTYEGADPTEPGAVAQTIFGNFWLVAGIVAALM